MILLQPIEYNAVGEKIILVDGKKVLESVLMERPKLAKISSMGSYATPSLASKKIYQTDLTFKNGGNVNVYITLDIVINVAG
ncbi:13783_t:CDS:2 [Entrophospora sp. SA101]|nr:10459_t:CDS:2 [Entrophospora sp. SA101]CAJ0841260.1 13783_t:CDS:2 [Entrophospora sp. SA101]